MTEPSAASGRYSEAEEEKNKENHEALQASEATMFFSVAVGKCEASPPLRPLRIVEISSVLTVLIFLLCFNLEKSTQNR